MNPETKEFIRDTEKANLPKKWTRFTKGEEILIKGIPFLIDGITRKKLVVRPKKSRRNVDGKVLEVQV